MIATCENYCLSSFKRSAPFFYTWTHLVSWLRFISPVDSIVRQRSAPKPSDCSYGLREVACKVFRAASIPLILTFVFDSLSTKGFILISTSYPMPYLFFKCWDEPKHLNFPSTIIPILGQRASASSIEWVVRTTVDFLLWVEILEIMFHMNLLAWGSTPVEGSSSSTIGGLPIKAIEHWSFLLLPPDSLPA